MNRFCGLHQRWLQILHNVTIYLCGSEVVMSILLLLVSYNGCQHWTPIAEFLQCLRPRDGLDWQYRCPYRLERMVLHMQCRVALTRSPSAKFACELFFTGWQGVRLFLHVEAMVWGHGGRNHSLRESDGRILSSSEYARSKACTVGVVEYYTQSRQYGCERSCLFFGEIEC